MSVASTPPPLPADAVALVRALSLTKLEMRRLWAFIYETYCDDHAPPKDPAQVALELPQFVAALGDHDVPKPEANALFTAACTAGADSDLIGWSDWVLGLLAFDSSTPHEGAWASRRAECVFRRYEKGSIGGGAGALSADDLARLKSDAQTAAPASAAAIVAAAAPLELLCGGGASLQLPEFLRSLEQQPTKGAALLSPLCRIAWSARADDSLDEDGGGADGGEAWCDTLSAGLSAVSLEPSDDTPFLSPVAPRTASAGTPFAPDFDSPPPTPLGAATTAPPAAVAAATATAAAAATPAPAGSPAALPEAASDALRAVQAVLALLPSTSTAPTDQRRAQAFDGAQNERISFSGARYATINNKRKKGKNR